MQQLCGALIGASKCFTEVVGRIPVLSLCDATVLISGETGTGKDLLARAIHYQGPRQGKPFVPVNCAALPDHLVENELFGHSKGAFTDAASEHKGLLAEADGGTLLLDEVNSLSLSAQGKLLRFLQNREYRPLGSSKNRTGDVRIIAATNSDLRQLVKEKLFREDLFHRLNILSMSIPPLRERPEDISVLAQHFVAHYGQQYGRGEVRCDGTTFQKLLMYDWPGNVRELEAVIQKALILTSSTILHPGDIELPVRDEEQRPDSAECFQAAKAKAIERFERIYLSNLLATYKGNVSQAARSAGTERRSLQRLLRKHRLDRRVFQKSA